MLDKTGLIHQNGNNKVLPKKCTMRQFVKNIKIAPRRSTQLGLLQNCSITYRLTAKSKRQSTT
ncbi:1370_t:CDS:1, partial [Rhizophagus irregularis]